MSKFSTLYIYLKVTIFSGYLIYQNLFSELPHFRPQKLYPLILKFIAHFRINRTSNCKITKINTR